MATSAAHTTTTMAYYQPEQNLRAKWTTDASGRPDGGAHFWLTYQGREWERTVGPDELVTAIEAAVLAEVSRASVYMWIRNGQLQAYELNDVSGRIRERQKAVRLSDLLAFLIANRR